MPSGPGYSLTRFTFPSPFKHDRVIAYRMLPTLVPRGGSKPAVVLAIPGSGRYGAAGLLGKVDDYQRAAGVRLVEHGYAVYVIETFGEGERSIDTGWMGDRGLDSPSVLGIYGLYSGEYLARVFVADLMAALQIIKNDPAVDRTKIVTFGISRGGYLAMLVAALDETIRGCVVASVLRDPEVYATDFLSQPLIPSEGKYFLRSDIAGTIAPRPILITYGKNFVRSGPVFPEALELAEEVKTLRTASRVRAIYEKAGAASQITVKLHERGHTWDEQATLEFLQKTLGY